MSIFNVKILGMGILSGMVLLFAAAPGSAHHSRFAHFLVDENITIEGVVKEFQFRNPHSVIFLDVTDEEGNTTIWAAEARSTAGMRSQGISPDSFKPGDKLVVSGMPSRSNRPRLLLVKAVRASDGFVMINEQAVAETSGGNTADGL